MENRPKGRQKHVSGDSKGVHRRGEGLGTGPVGSGSHQSVGGSQGSKGRGSGSGGRSSGGGTRSGGGFNPLTLIIALVVIVFGGGNFLLGGSGSSSSDSASSSGSSSWPSGYYQSSSSNTGWNLTSNKGKLDETVADGSRAKYTSIKGSGKDTITIMVYMCGTDLESKSGMATSDLTEMANATLSDNINLIVYTGGCSKWNNNIVSNKVNQIYQVKKGGLTTLKKDAGSGAMTDPSTLASFIQYCNKNFPADRNELILWDHGGGSVSGYGYDEKNASSGSMSLSGIRTALKKGGVTFDFVGFDACLMATVENALMLNDYADYLIASEETEPGIGWYYTDWLTALSKNTSMSTLEIGQNIIDSFIEQCNSKCRGQATTLSIVDLAETACTVSSKLNSFASATSELIENNQYKQVSDARYQAREFAQSSQIDQIDLAHFAKNLNTTEGDELAQAVLGAVKYNNTSSAMTNAYGLSIYFPYRKTSKVDTAVKTYQAIGMDDEYSRCIQSFAKMEVSGQAVSGGSSSPYQSLSGNSTSYSMDSDAMMQVLSSLMGGNLSGLSQSLLGLDSSNISFLTGKSLDDSVVSDYVTETQLPVEDLVWTEENGHNVMKLSEEEWSMIHDLTLNMFYDDGEGYVDLGLDNVFDFDEDGNLIGETDKTWLAINGQPVAYYYDKTMEDGDESTITGYVPAYLNGGRVKLIIVFDKDNPDGYIAGASTDYQNAETETVAKNLMELEEGDQLDFVCDYYSYDGEYQDSYYLGETMTVTDEMTISNVSVGDGEVICSYYLTDIYNQTYWTPSF